MLRNSLSGVTLQTLKNYRIAATETVVAYRLGGHRLVRAVDGALKNSVYARTAKLAPRATDRMDEVRGNLSQIVVKGIDRVAERTERVIEAGSANAAEQLKRVASFAAGIENEAVAGGLQTAVRLTLPGAQVALIVSSKIAEGAHALADAAGARTTRKAARKAVASSKRQAAATQRKISAPARQARSALNTATRRAGEVARAVEAEAAKVPRRARAAKKAVVEAAAG